MFFFSYLKSWILFLNFRFILDFTFEFYVVEDYMGFFFELFLLIVDKCSFDRYWGMHFWIGKFQLLGVDSYVFLFGANSKQSLSADSYCLFLYSAQFSSLNSYSFSLDHLHLIYPPTSNFTLAHCDFETTGLCIFTLSMIIILVLTVWIYILIVI